MTDIVNVPAIPALPIPPSTNDPNNFSARADGFLGILPEWSARMGEVADAAKTNATAAQERAAIAQAAASTATAQASNAAASAELAKNAPTTYGITYQTLTIAAGEVNVTVEAGRAFVSGQAVVLASIETPTSQRMYGVVTAYDPTTGALTVAVSAYTGTGTATGWTVTLGNAPTVGGLEVVNISSNAEAASGKYYVMDVPGSNLMMPANPLINQQIGFCNISSGVVGIFWSGQTVRGVFANPEMMLIEPYQSAIVRFNGNTWV